MEGPKAETLADRPGGGNDPCMTADPTEAAALPPPRRSPAASFVRWLPIILLVLATPVLIFAGVRVAFRRLSARTDTPGVRQLHEVGVAVRRYAQEHGGNYPAELGDLIGPGGLTPAMTVCPGTHVRYVYQGGRSSEKQVTNGFVLAYEPPEANGGRGSAVLYADGSASWVDRGDLDDELNRGKPAEALSSP